MPFSPNSPISHSRAAFALVSVSCVVNVLEQMTKSVVAGLICSSVSASSMPSTFETQCSADALVTETGERLGHHDDAEIRPTDADVDHVGEAGAGEAQDAPLVHAADEFAHLVELRAHLRHHVATVCVHRSIRAIAQRHVHGGAAFGVVDRLSRKERRDACRQIASLSERCQQAQRFRRDALAREVVEQVERLQAGGAEAARAAGREQVTEVPARQLGGVRFEGLPLRQAGAGCGHARSLDHRRRPLLVRVRLQPATPSCGAVPSSGPAPTGKADTLGCRRSIRDLPRAWKGRHALGRRSRIDRLLDDGCNVERCGAQRSAAARRSPAACGVRGVGARAGNSLSRVRAGVRSGLSWRARVCLSKRDRTGRIGRRDPHPACGRPLPQAGEVDTPESLTRAARDLSRKRAR